MENQEQQIQPASSVGGHDRKPKRIPPGLIPFLVFLILAFIIMVFINELWPNWTFRHVLGEEGLFYVLCWVALFVGVYALFMLVKRLIKKERPILLYVLTVIGILVLFFRVLSWYSELELPGVQRRNNYIKASMSELRIVAEMYYDLQDENDKNYTGLSCDSDDTKYTCNNIEKYTDTRPIFYVSSDKYCVHTKLSGKKVRYWCIDYSGFVGYGQCDGETFRCLSE